MFTILTIAAVVLAAMLTMSAILKLRQQEESVRIIHGVVGVPLRLFPVLAALELAGAIGVIAGLWLAPLGIAAAVGVVSYFVGAIAAHLRVRDTKGLLNPSVPLVLSLVVSFLRIITA